MRKSILFIILLVLAVIIIPTITMATSASPSESTVNSEDELINAIKEAKDGDTIILGKNIVLTKPLSVQKKKITIDGKGNTITREAENWEADGANSTLVTASLPETSLYLKNLNLTNAEKYGVQSYDAAHVILDNVTISNCGYGAVLVNAGTVEVRNLTLNRNGKDTNNGIEIAKGKGTYTEGSQPVLIMNGALQSTEKENVVYIAVNDELTEFEVKNTETTTDKIYLSGNKIIVTDAQNNIKFISNENDEIDMEGEPFVKNVTVSVNLNDKIVTITTLEGSTLSREDVLSKINLQELGLSNYTISSFYSDNTFTTEFNFANPISTDITIYAKLDATQENTPQPAPEPTPEPAPVPEKDDTPKTGTDNTLGIAISAVIISVIAIVITRKKSN